MTVCKCHSNLFHSCWEIATTWWYKRKSLGITKVSVVYETWGVSRIHPLETMNICTRRHGNHMICVYIYNSCENWNDPKFCKRSSACRGSNTVHNSDSFMCVCVDELQSEDELDKELLWNLQLLSEVRQESITSQWLQHSKKLILLTSLCLKSLLNQRELKEIERSAPGVGIFTWLYYKKLF